MEANGLQELRKFKLATLSDLSWDGRILGLSGPRWRFCRFDGDIKAAVAFFAPKKVNDRPQGDIFWRGGWDVAGRSKAGWHVSDYRVLILWLHIKYSEPNCCVYFWMQHHIFWRTDNMVHSWNLGKSAKTIFCGCLKLSLYPSYESWTKDYRVIKCNCDLSFISERH